MTPGQRVQTELHSGTDLLLNGSGSGAPNEPLTPSILTQVLWLLSRPRLVFYLLRVLLTRLLVVFLAWFLVQLALLPILWEQGRQGQLTVLYMALEKDLTSKSE